MFPNEHNVYLHSTPSQELFSRTRRDFSHGCIRVEDPAKLAEYILQGNGGWTKDKIVAAMNSGPDSQQVNLAQKRPVVIIYATAVVLPDGTVKFFQDIYGHDARLEKALGQGLSPSAREMVLPAPHPSHVNVHEVRSGVISHSPAMQAERRVAQFGGGDSRQANVNGLCLHVEAMLGHTGVGAAGAEEFVGLRGAVAADHVDFTPRIVHRLGQVIQQVKQSGIEVMNIAGAVIAQKMVQPVERRGQIRIAAAIDDIQPLVGVGVIKAEPVFAGRLKRRVRAASR